MRTITKTIFEASDGTPFEDREHAEKYEARLVADHPWTVVGAATSDEIRAAIAGSDPSLGDAIERVAYLISKGRRERGDYKRRPRPVAEDDDHGGGFDGPTGAD